MDQTWTCSHRILQPGIWLRADFRPPHAGSRIEFAEVVLTPWNCHSCWQLTPWLLAMQTLIYIYYIRYYIYIYKLVCIVAGWIQKTPLKSLYFLCFLVVCRGPCTGRLHGAYVMESLPCRVQLLQPIRSVGGSVLYRVDFLGPTGMFFFLLFLLTSIALRNRWCSH